MPVAEAHDARGWKAFADFRQEPHGNDRKAALEATNRNDPADAEKSDTPWSIVADASLPLELKRAALMALIFTERLIDQATNEGMPENGRPSRLHDVQEALAALEREARFGPAACAQSRMAS